MSRFPLLAALALTALAACSHRPPMIAPDDFGPRPEKMVLAALREIAASDDQRRAILQAFDETQPRLAMLTSNTEALLTQWQELDRRDPAFARQADALAERWASSARERLGARAAFEGRVAAALDGAQWQDWQAFWNRAAFGPGSFRGNAAPQSRRRR